MSLLGGPVCIPSMMTTLLRKNRQISYDYGIRQKPNWLSTPLIPISLLSAIAKQYFNSSRRSKSPCVFVPVYYYIPTYYVRGCIVFVFPSVRPSTVRSFFRLSVRSSALRQSFALNLFNCSYFCNHIPNFYHDWFMIFL